jgi:hypothetical protein
VFERCSVADFAALLHDIAGRVELSRYPKHKRSPKKPPPKRACNEDVAHIATAKLLAVRKGRKSYLGKHSP